MMSPCLSIKVENKPKIISQFLDASRIQNKGGQTFVKGFLVNYFYTASAASIKK